VNDPTVSRRDCFKSNCATTLFNQRDSAVLTLVLWFPIRIPAWFYLGGWFLYQFFESNYTLVHRQAGGSGVAFFAHVGGFVFGVIVARVLVSTGRIAAQQTRSNAT
jgi:membrane associated rhomboid family serine protease